MADLLDVLVVSPPTRVWGAQLRLLEYAPALARRGLRLTLGSPPEGDFHAAWVGQGLPHREVAVPHLAGITIPETGRRPPPGQLSATAWRSSRGAVALFGAIGDYDVVWSFALRAHPLAVIAARLRKVPIVIEIVDIVRPGIGRPLLQACSALADATIVNSAATGAALHGRGRDVHIVHPGVDTRRFRPGDPPLGLRDQLGDDGGVLVGIAGRIDPAKRIDVLVDAMALVPPALDARLVIVGDVGVRTKEYARQLEARARRLLGPRVRFVGRRDDMPDVLRALDILVNASDIEPFGRSVLEAQATGLGVIGTRQGGIPEFVTDGKTGLLVEPGDVEDMARAVTELAGDAALRARLGDASRSHAVERFDIVDRYDRVTSIITGVVRR